MKSTGAEKSLMLERSFSAQSDDETPHQRAERGEQESWSVQSIVSA
jgi:hypothetical protein